MSDADNIDALLVSHITKTEPPVSAPTPPEVNDDSAYEVTPESSQEEPRQESETVRKADKQEPEAQDSDHDEYGNDKPTPKTYTEDEHKDLLNKAVRERLARMERNQPQQPEVPTQQPPQVHPTEPVEGDWQRELETFVKQTVQQMSAQEQRQTQQRKEQQAQAEFESKFHDGMSKFPDFVETLSSQPITDAMTMATRSMKDPAAFLYAAAKRNPAELDRIAKLGDPVAQMVEMGKLEERMRKAPMSSNAPRPRNKIQEDIGTKTEDKKREPTIEDLMHEADRKRTEQRNKIYNKR